MLFPIHSFNRPARRLLGALCCLLPVPAFAAESVAAEELATEWTFHGSGSRAVERGMFYMAEAHGSQGVMVVSLGDYPEEVTVKYEIMPLSAASVCVVILSASDPGEARSPTLPEGYDGSMGHWIDHVDNHFFAFHNAAHNRTPFVIRFPQKQMLARHDRNVLVSGRFHAVEVGRDGDRLRFTVDGETLLEARDEDPPGPGHIAFRIRGLTEEPASCLIRNVTIESEGDESD